MKQKGGWGFARLLNRSLALGEPSGRLHSWLAVLQRESPVPGARAVLSSYLRHRPWAGLQEMKRIEPAKTPP